MAKYQRVSPKFWQDPKVRRWPDHQKLLGAYLLTCPHRTSEGLFWLPHGYVAQDLGWSIERVSEGYSGLEEAGFCAYDDTTETVLLCKALKYEAPAGPKQIQGAISRLADVPPSPLFALLRDAAVEYAPEFAKGLDEAFESGLLRHHRYPRDTPPEGYPLARARSSSSSSSSSSEDQHHRRASSTGDDPTQAVFDAWRESTGKERAQLDDKRLRKIKAALRTYPLPDVLDAVRGWANSPHHCGENDTGTVYHELTLLLRDAEHIERFRDLWRAGPANGPPGKATLRMVRTAQDMRRWAEQMEGGGGDSTRVGTSRPAAQRELPGPAG